MKEVVKSPDARDQNGNCARTTQLPLFENEKKKKEKAIARTESRGTLSCQQHRRARRPTKRGKSRLHVANGDIEALAFRGGSQRTITKPLKTEMVATETRQNNRTL